MYFKTLTIVGLLILVGLAVVVPKDKKDSTAQSIANIRHYESLHDPSTRLYHDPYAYAMYPGSGVLSWLGESRTHWLYRTFGIPGLLEYITIRTKWLDDQVLKATAEGRVKQLVLLGAGYDTRGFRLDLPQEDFRVFEVDQPQVQQEKVRKLKQLLTAKNDEVIASRMGSFVKFLPVNFNDRGQSSSIDAVLRQAEGYSTVRRTVVVMEGVTMYLPKSSTADTLTRLKKVMPPGSVLLITYIDQSCFEDSSGCGGKSWQRISKFVGSVGEPFISGWTPEGFQSFLGALGYKVLSDKAAPDLKQYLTSVQREWKEEDELYFERFAAAIFE